MSTSCPTRPPGTAVRVGDVADGPSAGRQQLAPQCAPALDVQRLIDRLVRHPHLRIGRMIVAQPGRDLLGRPALAQQRLNPPPEPGVAGEPGGSRRRAVRSARASPRHARYSCRCPLAATSREMVEGARPRPRAIWRSNSPARSPRLISSRSATESRSGERSLTRGGSPPTAWRTRRTVTRWRPSLRATAAIPSPAAIRRRISSASSGPTSTVPRCRPISTSPGTPYSVPHEAGVAMVT